MRLDEIAVTYGAIDRALEDSGGEVTPEIQAALEAIDLSEKEKVDGYIFVLKALEGEGEALKKVEDELAAKRSAIIRRKKWMMDRVWAYMRERKVTELPGSILKGFKEQNAGGVRGMEILEPNPYAWPEEYRTVTLNESMVRAQIDPAGQVVLPGPGGSMAIGAYLKPRGTVLRYYV